jgi:hypothetical protein
MNLINEMCPYFKIGTCIKNKCKYKYHIICKNNYTCFNYDCEYGHGISILKRKILSKLYEKLYNFSFNEENSCINKLKCINQKCKLSHHFFFKEREFLFKLFNENNNLKCKELYENNYSYNLHKKYNNISKSINNSSNDSLSNDSSSNDSLSNDSSSNNDIEFTDIETELNLLVDNDNLDNLLLNINIIINNKKHIQNEIFKLIKINKEYDEEIEEIQLKIKKLYIFKNIRI